MNIRRNPSPMRPVTRGYNSGMSREDLKAVVKEQMAEETSPLATAGKASGERFLHALERLEGHNVGEIASFATGVSQAKAEKAKEVRKRGSCEMGFGVAGTLAAIGLVAAGPVGVPVFVIMTAAAGLFLNGAVTRDKADQIEGVARKTDTLAKEVRAWGTFALQEEILKK